MAARVYTTSGNPVSKLLFSSDTAQTTVAIASDTAYEYRAKPVEADRLQSLTLKVAGKTYTFSDSNDDLSYETSFQITTPGTYAYSVTANYGVTTRSVAGIFQVDDVTTPVVPVTVPASVPAAVTVPEAATTVPTPTPSPVAEPSPTPEPTPLPEEVALTPFTTGETTEPEEEQAVVALSTPNLAVIVIGLLLGWVAYLVLGRPRKEVPKLARKARKTVKK